MIVNYKRILLILGIAFVLISLSSFYSLVKNDGSIVVNIISESRTLPMLIIDSLLSGVIITGIVHAIMFIVYFVKNHPGNKGILFIVLALVFPPLTVILGVVSVIPYAIYCIIKIHSDARKSNSHREAITESDHNTGDGSMIC